MYDLLEAGLRVGTLNPVADGWYPKSCTKWLHGVPGVAMLYKPNVDCPVISPKVSLHGNACS